LSTWAGVAWDVVFGVAALMVAFNIRDFAWRIHGSMANWIGVNRLFTPTLVRVTCGMLGVLSIADVAVSLAQAA
jgi:hypothetical protein